MQRIIHDRLGFTDNGFQMPLIAEAFGVNLVNIFRAGGTGGEPAGGGGDFQTADGRAIARGARQLGGDRLTRQVRLFYCLR